METLRRHLGSHPGATSGQLCVTELGSLVMRAGRAGGLIVRAEVQVPGHTGKRAITGEIDYGWFCPKTKNWLVAWELDGRDAGKGHIGGTDDRLGNAKKFAACPPTVKLKVQVLYALKNNLTPWSPSKADQSRTLLGPNVRVISDEDLMRPNGIESFINEARQLAGLEGL